jgi:hypothetical protein
MKYDKLIYITLIWESMNKARNQDNMSECGDMSTSGLLLQWASTIKIQLSVLVENKTNIIIISLTINLFLPWYSWEIAELAFNNNHSLTVLFVVLHTKNKLIVNEMMMMFVLFSTNTLSWIFIVLAHWNNSPQVYMSLHSDTLSWFRDNRYLLLLLRFLDYTDPFQKLLAICSFLEIALVIC